MAKKRGRAKKQPVIEEQNCNEEGDPLEKKDEAFDNSEVERQCAAIRALRDVEIEQFGTMLRLLRSYFSEDQLQVPVLQFFRENLPNLSLEKAEKDGQYEVKWKQKDVDATLDHADERTLHAALLRRLSLAYPDFSAGIPSLGGFEFSNQSVKTSLFAADKLQNKDVLVEFYAPWCGHCKSLAPIYEKVATAFNLEEDMVIANVDADAHKDLAEKYGISGFPTLKFFPKNNKAGEDYDGGRDLDDFVTFINEKGGTSRDAKGKLTSTAGIIEDLGSLVKEFLSAKDDERKVIFKRLEEEAGKLKGSAARYGKIYVKAAKSCMEKGSDYAKNEILRLERIVSKSISPTKADEFTLKKNILSMFA